MDAIPHDLAVLFMILLGVSTLVLSRAIKRLRKSLGKVKKEVVQLDRRLEREEYLTRKLVMLMGEQVQNQSEIEAILSEMRHLQNST